MLQSPELTTAPVDHWREEAKRQQCQTPRGTWSGSGSMNSQPLVQYASRTDVGMRRTANQDSLVTRLCSEADEWSQMGHLFVVADGMGGHAVGDLASRIAVETLPHAYLKSDTESIKDRVRDAVVAANRAIGDKGRENPEFSDMGTTCSALTLSPEGAIVGHVGDSRIYRVREGGIEQLTFDHSLQWEMIRQGHATVDNVDLLHPRNVITRCLGPEDNVRVDVEGPFDIRPGDQFVLCSDGLTGHVSDREIGSIVSHLNPAEATRLLIDMANFRGGTDNSTVVVIHVQDYPKVTGEVVDKRAPATKTAEFKKPRRSIWSQISLGLFTVLSTFGLIFLINDRRNLGLVLISFALLQGFVRLIVAASRSQSSGADEDVQESSAVKRSKEPKALSDEPPYQTSTAALSGELLEYLAKVQSELTQAAQENGWTVDVAKLAEWNRSASEAYQQKQGNQCLKNRAQAIEHLMQQVYARVRPH